MTQKDDAAEEASEEMTAEEIEQDPAIRSADSVIEDELKTFSYHFAEADRKRARCMLGYRVEYTKEYGKVGTDPLQESIVATDDGSNPSLREVLKFFRGTKLLAKGQDIRISMLRFFLEAPVFSITEYPQTVITKKVTRLKSQ